MKRSEGSTHGRTWLGLLVLALAIVLWMPEQLWSNRRVLLFLGVRVALAAVVFAAWCFYRIRRTGGEGLRAIYLSATFRTTRGLVGQAVREPRRSAKCRL